MLILIQQSKHAKKISENFFSSHKCQLHHQSVCICSLMVKNESNWLHPEELRFEAKMSFHCMILTETHKLYCLPSFHTFRSPCIFFLVVYSFVNTLPSQTPHVFCTSFYLAICVVLWTLFHQTPHMLCMFFYLAVYVAWWTLFHQSHIWRNVFLPCHSCSIVNTLPSQTSHTLCTWTVVRSASSIRGCAGTSLPWKPSHTIVCLSVWCFVGVVLVGLCSTCM